MKNRGINTTMIEIYTLIDVTQTHVKKNYRSVTSKMSQSEWDFHRNQQRNFQTCVQLLGLRFQPTLVIAPVCFEHWKLEIPGFGRKFYFDESIRIWKFCVQYEQEVDLNQLLVDFNNIPIITGLQETVHFPQSCILTSGPFANLTLNSYDNN